MNNKDDLIKIVLAGRPNVGKSTIFNIFAGKRISIEFSKPGTTRDPVEKIVEIGNKKVLLVDTGGFEFGSKDPLYTLIGEKAKQYIQNSDLVLFVIEKENIIDEDLAFLRFIKKNAKNYILIINKCEGKFKDLLPKEVYRLGVKKMIPISAIHRDNIDAIEDEILAIFNDNPKLNSDSTVEKELTNTMKLAIVGRPNTGKSTLLNCILNENKAIVSDIPGTTRDAIEASIKYDDHNIILVDTAGIRKKRKIDDDLEYYCIKRSFDAIDNADIVIHVIESTDLITSQDKKISDYIINKGKGYILAINKIDLILSTSSYNKNLNLIEQEIENEINYKFPHILYIKKIFISAMDNINIDILLRYSINLYSRVIKELKTSQLNKVIEKIVDIKPILVGSSFLNLLYMVQVKNVPRIFKIFTNKNPDEIPAYYTQYIINELRNQLELESIPIRIKFEKRKNKN